jgi:proteic killer suppression protein
VPDTLAAAARRRLAFLNAAVRLQDLRNPPGNRLHAPGGDRAGQYAIRVNDQYRLTFVWSDEGPEEVELVDYH